MKRDQQAFIEELAIQLDTWTKSVSNTLTNPLSDLIWTDSPESFKKIQNIINKHSLGNEIEEVLKESFRGLLHSVLVAFDGGTALSEKVKLTIESDSGEIFDKNLHELFINHLFKTGRLE